MKFIPIPTDHDHLRAWSKHWLPFLPKIGKRTDEPIENLFDALASGRVQLGLVWDGERAHAIVGMQYRQLGKELIGEIIWLAGKGMDEWQELLPELERYLREHVGCTVSRPICRPGWSRMLKQAGYTTTHYVMERRL